MEVPRKLSQPDAAHYQHDTEDDASSSSSYHTYISHYPHAEHGSVGSQSPMTNGDGHKHHDGMIENGIQIDDNDDKLKSASAAHHYGYQHDSHDTLRSTTRWSF